MTKCELLLKTDLNVFNVDDLVAIWSASSRREVLESVKGYVKRGKLFSIYRGVYSLTPQYDSYELAQKLFTPSYITYYSALSFFGINFQHYDDVHLFGSNSKIIVVDNRRYVFHKAKFAVLMDSTGIIHKKRFSIASPERAICDSLYVNKGVGFDNLRNLDVKKIKEVSKIYYNKRLDNDVNILIKQIAKKEC